MLTINSGTFVEAVSAFESGDYSKAVFPVKDIATIFSFLEELGDWKISRVKLTATKGIKEIRFVYSVEHTYGLNFDYMGIVDGIPESEDFLYYTSRLRRVI